MRELTLASGVTPEIYDTFGVIDVAITEEELLRKWVWLNEIRSTAFFGVLEIWRLLTPEVWKRYDEFLEVGLREQKLLKERRRTLKKVWVKYHKESKIDKNHKEEDPVSSPGV